MIKAGLKPPITIKTARFFAANSDTKKLAKIKLPDTEFGKSLDPEGKGYFMAVCECKCGLSKKEIEQKQSSEIEYLCRQKMINKISEKEFTADDDLPFE